MIDIVLLAVKGLYVGHAMVLDKRLKTAHAPLFPANCPTFAYPFASEIDLESLRARMREKSPT